ncbi:hypothetical protein VTJ49DRAFT_6232 [Mycothermus thermophilus]|uniref:Proteophosphoglycan ppg4 n=1 Tax=Humicola insolens TaxID=85995 RepID=A0ABR3VJC9_HUMIN
MGNNSPGRQQVSRSGLLKGCDGSPLKRGAVSAAWQSPGCRAGAKAHSSDAIHSVSSSSDTEPAKHSIPSALWEHLKSINPAVFERPLIGHRFHLLESNPRRRSTDGLIAARQGTSIPTYLTQSLLALTLQAHDHARAAAKATQAAETTVAVNEHAQAAGEFANASRITTCHEALRTLALLEQHHRRLSELLKLPVRRPAPATADDISEDGKESQRAPEPASSASQKDSPAAAPKTANKPPPALSPPRYPSRNLSSSIASNLASARGIRARYTAQPLTSVSSDQAPGSLEVRPRGDSAKGKSPESRKPSWVPPVIHEDSVDEPPKSEPASSPASEDGFSRFYSAFGGLISRLSAPLAFAGLPLVAEEPSPAPTPIPAEPKRSRPKHTPSAAEPDLSKIYSRATLRALKRDHAASDSFYVVPPSGHTASYASILNHDTKEKRRQASESQHGSVGDDEDDDADFVDARELPPPASPTSRRGGASGKQPRTEAELRNAVEELRLENASLKDVLDRVSKRLHAFELNSQSSHLALAQSLRLQRPGSPTSSTVGGAAAGEEALKRRNRELEEQLAEMARRMEALEADHLKLQLTVEKYRDRWEKLKAGAKARRQQNQEAEGAKR